MVLWRVFCASSSSSSSSALAESSPLAPAPSSTGIASCRSDFPNMSLLTPLMSLRRIAFPKITAASCWKIGWPMREKQMKNNHASNQEEITIASPKAKTHIQRRKTESWPLSRSSRALRMNNNAIWGRKFVADVITTNVHWERKAHLWDQKSDFHSLFFFPTRPNLCHNVLERVW